MNEKIHIKKPVNIRAHEYNQWGFCPRQWYLYRITGRKPSFTKAMKKGLEYHHEEGRKIENVVRAQKSLIFNLKIGGVICILLLLFYLLFSL